MLLLHLYISLFLVVWCVDYSNGQLHLYYSSDGSKRLEYDYDCLDFYANDRISAHNYKSPYRRDHQIIPFCRRDNIDDGLIVPGIDMPIFTFKELNERNISSRDLYTWSAPIDLVEHYQAYREHKIDGKMNASLSKFYNCSFVHRFGLRCQYYFDSSASSTQTFDNIVTDLLKKSVTLPTNGVCYVHINCTRNNYSWCLDWREICDGKVDCWPEPVDEEQCYELERNECDEGQYRCRNGQCIPQEYVLDNSFDPDCFDTTDESLPDVSAYPAACSKGDPSIRCSDTSCRHWTESTCPGQHCTGAGSCRSQHRQQFDRFLVARTTNSHLKDECWSTMICLTGALPVSALNDTAHAHLFNGSCNTICPDYESCTKRMHEHCPPLFEFPAQPIAWNNAHLFYSRNGIYPNGTSRDYICFNDQSCNYWPFIIRISKMSEPTTLLSCRILDEPIFMFTNAEWNNMLARYRSIFRRNCTSTATNIENDCPETTQFRCGKKCLSKHRLVDSKQDCADDSDENYNNSCTLNDKHRMRYIHEKRGVYVDECMIRMFAIEFGRELVHVITEQLPHFPTLCDSYIEYKQIVNGEIETDETNCKEWLCDNQYTRCDDIWNCLNGADEIDCNRQFCNNENAHPCVVWNSSRPICLPISRAGDGIIDCVGATDERHLCRDDTSIGGFQGNMYRCLNNRTDDEQMMNELTTSSPEKSLCISFSGICDNKIDCPLKDDEHQDLCKDNFFDDLDCEMPRWNKYLASFLICDLNDDYKRSMSNMLDSYAPHFSLANYSIRPLPSNVVSLISKVALEENVAEDATLMIHSQRQAISVPFHCHGGILINMLRNGATLSLSDGEKRCLCPPTFYGAQCEYQNQRVTVTLQIGNFDGQTPFTVVVYLLDDKYHIVQSFHQINYVSIRDCRTKFGLQLLYSSRPKASNSNYLVRIDAFETKTLYYRASWIFPIVYSFLPVYRLSILLAIPMQPLTSEDPCPLKCSSVHGQCIIYVNTGQFFCRCKPGWFGPHCTNSYECDCSPDSICAGSWKDRSICVCPLRKFGPRCYLTNNVCEQQKTEKCYHNGQCIPSDVRIASDPTASCICPVEFYGTTCSNNQSRIDISFTSLYLQNIPAHILLHFITVRTHPSSRGYSYGTREWGPHERLSTFKKIPIDRVSITVYWNNVFHLLFTEDQHNMYLLILQTKYKPSVNYNVTLEPSQRCPPIRELLNSTIVSFPLLRRVKYYHIPCQQRSELACFHDEDQFMCLCTYDHRANCFSFDYHMKYTCLSMSHCENGGQCFQNSMTCPSAAICACPSCYFGTRCHLSTKGFGLPLDVILGYQIWPNVTFTEQPLTLRTSVFITVFMLILGIINGILSIPTFQRKIPRQFGCGVYLYIASIISLLTMITFTLKFVLLVLTQLLIITSRTVLIGQCASVDFLLKVFLQTGDWLYACVAVERLFSVIISISFNKSLSKKMAKWVIGFILIFVVGTSIHEAYYRSLIDDVEEQRTWCIVRYPKSYSSSLTRYTSIMSIVHFMGPFVINIVSAVGIIMIATRYRSKTEKKRPYRSHLHNQIRQHKYLIISPIVLILLSVPRIILAFTLECMKSARDSVTLFLVGYFVSFIPPILTFVIFVLPSKLYIKAFKDSMQSLRDWLYCKSMKQ